MPDVPRRLMCIPIDIPSRYFPLVLYLFFTLLSGPELSYALGMFVGYLYMIGKLDSIKPSTQRLQHIETAGFLSSLSRYSGWIPVGSALGVSVFTGDVPNGGPPSRSSGDVESNQPTVGTVWRTGKHSQANSASTDGASSQATQPQNHPFPGSGRTLSASSGGGMSSLWSSSTTSSHTDSKSESKSQRAEMAARRLAAMGQSSYQSAAPPPHHQYVAGVASAPTAFSNDITTLIVSIHPILFPHRTSVGDGILSR
jgi:hypothetical protein